MILQQNAFSQINILFMINKMKTGSSSITVRNDFEILETTLYCAAIVRHSNYLGAICNCGRVHSRWNGASQLYDMR